MDIHIFSNLPTPFHNRYGRVYIQLKLHFLIDTIHRYPNQSRVKLESHRETSRNPRHKGKVYWSEIQLTRNRLHFDGFITEGFGSDSLLSVSQYMQTEVPVMTEITTDWGHHIVADVRVPGLFSMLHKAQMNRKIGSRFLRILELPSLHRYPKKRLYMSRSIHRGD